MTTRGFENVIDDIYDVMGNAESRHIVGQALQEAAVPIRDKIKENIIAGGHIRTGALIDSISIGKLTGLRKNGYRIKVGVIGNRAPHAHLVEYGHGGPAPAPEHPFMAPAYESEKQHAADLLAQAIKEALGL